jgi:hypothetical protein
VFSNALAWRPDLVEIGSQVTPDNARTLPSSSIKSPESARQIRSLPSRAVAEGSRSRATAGWHINVMARKMAIRMNNSLPS